MRLSMKTLFSKRGVSAVEETLFTREQEEAASMPAHQKQYSRPLNTIIKILTFIQNNRPVEWWLRI